MNETDGIARPLVAVFRVGVSPPRYFLARWSLFCDTWLAICQFADNICQSGVCAEFPDRAVNQVVFECFARPLAGVFRDVDMPFQAHLLSR